MPTKPLSQLDDDMAKKASEIQRVISRDVPVYVGEMLVDGFRESFDLQRFNDTGSAPWQQVKRRMTSSPWYGFAYKAGGGANYKVPKGATALGNKGKKGGKTNFSPRAAKRAILHGAGTAALRDSIYLHTATRGRIVVASNEAHAEVHNEGKTARIFGRKEFIMPQRKFMGSSEVLNKRARRIIDNRIKRIL